MGDTNAGSSHGADVSPHDLMKALTTLLEQQRRNQNEDHHSTKALQSAVNKLGRFDGRNITKYLRVYTCEMEVHRVPDAGMISSFELAVIPEIRGRVKDLQVSSWSEYEQLLKDEFFDDDAERITKRVFLSWVEEQPGKTMLPNELLREFEKRFSQLSNAEKLLLEMKKTELFLQAADEVLEEKLCFLLADKSEEGGLTSDWKKVEDAVVILTKQGRGRFRSTVPRETPSTSTNCSCSKSTSGCSTGSTTPAPPMKDSKGSNSDTAIEELIKGIKELRVEMAELKRGSRPSTPRIPGSFVRRCIWCDSPDHERA